jgi:hypothetical protein
MSTSSIKGDNLLEDLGIATSVDDDAVDGVGVAEEGTTEKEVFEAERLDIPVVGKVPLPQLDGLRGGGRGVRLIDGAQRDDALKGVEPLVRELTLDVAGEARKDEGINKLRLLFDVKGGEGGVAERDGGAALETRLTIELDSIDVADTILAGGGDDHEVGGDALALADLHDVPGDDVATADVLDEAVPKDVEELTVGGLVGLVALVVLVAILNGGDKEDNA